MLKIVVFTILNALVGIHRHNNRQSREFCAECTKELIIVYTTLLNKRSAFIERIREIELVFMEASDLFQILVTFNYKFFSNSAHNTFFR